MDLIRVYNKYFIVGYLIRSARISNNPFTLRNYADNVSFMNMTTKLIDDILPVDNLYTFDKREIERFYTFTLFTNSVSHYLTVNSQF